MDQVFCTTREAAKLLGVCVRTAQLWVEQGRLCAWKTPGGHRRILRESVSVQLRLRKTTGGFRSDVFDVLIVEDDSVARQLLQSKIAEILPEISVRTAINGVDAVLKIGELQSHVVIIDLNMPGLDGCLLLETLSSSPLRHSLQIIVNTRLSEGMLPVSALSFRLPTQAQLLVAMVRLCHDGWSGQRCAISTPGVEANPLNRRGRKNVRSEQQEQEK